MIPVNVALGALVILATIQAFGLIVNPMLAIEKVKEQWRADIEKWERAVANQKDIAERQRFYHEASCKRANDSELREMALQRDCANLRAEIATLACAAKPKPRRRRGGAT